MLFFHRPASPPNRGKFTSKKRWKQRLDYLLFKNSFSELMVQVASTGPIGHMALNLLQQERIAMCGIKAKRRKRWME